MSYDLHIAKTAEWVDSESNPITEKELKKVGQLMSDLPFIFQEGRLTLCGADSTVIPLMIEIATHLNAQVQGDEREYYNDPTLYHSVIQSQLVAEKSNTLKIDLFDWVDAIQVGDTIHHVKFGIGKIDSIIGEQQDKEFIVQFADKNKRILAYYATNKYHVVK